MKTDDARILRRDLLRRGISILLATIKLYTPGQARAAQLWLERVPTFEEWMSEREQMLTCRVCGCSEDDPCEDGCEWIEDNLCSACAVVEPAAKKGARA